MWYYEDEHNLVETYATGDLIVEAGEDMMQFAQPSNALPREHVSALFHSAEEFWKESLTCNIINNEYVLKAIFFEVWSESIRLGTCSYWGSRRNVTLHGLKRHGTSLFRF